MGAGQVFDMVAVLLLEICVVLLYENGGELLLEVVVFIQDGSCTVV